MVLRELLAILDEISPFELQESWDNSGLIVGDLNQKIDEVYLSLDLEERMFASLKPNSLLVVHHPLIFKGLMQIDPTKYPGNILYQAIRKNIAIVAMHTNYDQTHLNRYVLEEVLGYTMQKVEGFLGYFEVNKPFDLFAKEVAGIFGIENFRVVKAKEFVKTAALCTGAGASLLDLFNGDCLLTGDIKYHEALKAKEEGVCLLDIGHFESERYFAASLQKELETKGINGIIAYSDNPFSHIKG